MDKAAFSQQPGRARYPAAHLSDSGPVTPLSLFLFLCLSLSLSLSLSHTQLPKVVRAWCVLPLFTWKCASRHSGMHFFHIATSKSGSNLRCFPTFYFEMCFAPHRCALFLHLNLQKWSEHGVFSTFLLPHVLRATTACTFFTSQLPKVV